MDINGTEGPDTLTGTPGDDVINGLGGDDNINGAAGNDTLDGGSGNDQLHGNEGDDTLYGGPGNDQLFGDDGNDTLFGDVGNDEMHGGAGGDGIFAYAGSYQIFGDDGNDYIVLNYQFAHNILSSTINGGAGDDQIKINVNPGDTSPTLTIDGGVGNDYLTLSNGTTSNNLITFDIARFLSLSTVSNIEVVIGYFGDGPVAIYGTELRDILEGGSGNDSLYGRGGNDDLYLDAGAFNAADGGAGDDLIRINIGSASQTFNIDGGIGFDTFEIRMDEGGTFQDLNLQTLLANGNRVVNVEMFRTFGTEGANYLTVGGVEGVSASFYAGGGDDILVGGDLADNLGGGAGNDILTGGRGGDTLTGGIGNDTFIYTSGADSNFDTGIFGTDIIGDFETGKDNIDLSTFDVWDLSIFAGGGNAITANTATGRLTFYVTGNVAQSDLILRANTGASVHGTSNGDTLSGDGLNNFLDGGSGSDNLSGFGGDDAIDGGAGIDNLYGGTGNDSFFVDQQADLAFENAGEGTDTVISTSNFYLYANIENLTLAAGAGNIFGVGNELANNITGNEGDNTLLAGAGIDVVHGGGGVDIIYGEDGADQLFGDANNDVLIGGNGDDVMDGGAGGDSLYGEAGNDLLYGGTTFEFDRLVGGDGNDVLHGDSGQADYDYLYGNAGDDSFYVDTGDDLTFEQAGEGTDTVYANVAGANNGVYLYANIENLVLLGTTTFGVGNELANTMTGNASGNYLLGGAGNDVLNGKGGNDVLFGQAGADTFVFEHSTGGDVIGDFVAGTDHIDLTAIGYTWQQVQNSLHENGGSTAIDLGNGDLVVLNGVTAAQLHQSDFILAGGSSGMTPPDGTGTKLDIMAIDTGALPANEPHGRLFHDWFPSTAMPAIMPMV